MICLNDKCNVRGGLKRSEENRHIRGKPDEHAAEAGTLEGLSKRDGKCCRMSAEALI